MFWNNVFWGFFAACEAFIIALIAAGQPYQYFLAGAFVMAMAAWKLAEDVRRNEEEKCVFVKRSILKKLKRKAGKL